VNLRPEQLVELVVGDHCGSTLDQDLEQFVHLRLEGYVLALPLELSSAQVENAVGELQPHGSRSQHFRQGGSMTPGSTAKKRVRTSPSPGPLPHRLALSGCAWLPVFTR